MRIDKDDLSEWLADWKQGATAILLIGVVVAVTWLIGAALAYGVFGLPISDAKVWGLVWTLIAAPIPVARTLLR